MASHNTHCSDINELAVGYRLNGNRWWNAACEAQFRRKVRLVERAAAVRQIERATRMATAVATWVGPITAVEWIGHTRTSVTCDVSPNHPADLILNGSVGVSCKSTNGDGRDVGIKNRGLGPLGARMHLPLRERVREETQRFVADCGAPTGADARKAWLRRPEQHAQAALAQARGAQLLWALRNDMLAYLTSVTAAGRKAFVEQMLMDADADTTYPRYLKVTGFGDGQQVPFGAKVHDPFHRALSEDVTVEAVGHEGIGFRHQGARLVVLRAKFESQKMASSVKTSTDPWGEPPA